MPGRALFAGMDRESGYALGFFFFWVDGASASALSLLPGAPDRGD